MCVRRSWHTAPLSPHSYVRSSMTAGGGQGCWDKCSCEELITERDYNLKTASGRPNWKCPIRFVWVNPKFSVDCVSTQITVMRTQAIQTSTWLKLDKSNLGRQKNHLLFFKFQGRLWISVSSCSSLDSCLSMVLKLHKPSLRCHLLDLIFETL